MHLPTRFLLNNLHPTRYTLHAVRRPAYKRIRESHRSRRMRLRARMSPGCFHRFYQRLMRHRRHTVILPAILTPRLVPNT